MPTSASPTRRIDLRPGQMATRSRPESHLHQRHRTHRDADQEPPDHPAQRARDPRLGGAPPFPDCGSLMRPAARSLAPAYADMRSRRDETGLRESGKVAGVADAMDGGTA